MKYIRRFSTVNVAKSAGISGLNNPHISVIDGSSALNIINASGETFACDFDNSGHVSRIQTCDEIWYTSTDGNIVEPTDGMMPLPIGSGAEVFGANIVSNTYTNGRGIIKFDGNVTKIGDGTFIFRDKLKSIIYPNTVTTIGYSAFQLCTGLTSFIIASNIISVGYDAFDNCYFQRSNLINNSTCTSTDNWGAILCDVEQTDGLLVSGTTAVKCRSWATNVVIPNNVTIIDTSAFEYCKSLSSITFGNSVTSIGMYAFRSCSSLTNIVLPNSVTTILNQAFNRCVNLNSVTLPNSLSNVGDYIFANCTNLTTITGTHSGISSDNRCFGVNGVLKAFAQASLSTYTIPSIYSSIGKGVFEGCSSLTGITIPNSVTTIENSAFYNSSSLSKVIIENSVTSIGEGAFIYCRNLIEVICNPTLPPTLGWGAFNSNASGRLIKVPSGSVNAYKSATNWSSYSSAIVSQ